MPHRRGKVVSYDSASFATSAPLGYCTREPRTRRARGGIRSRARRGRAGSTMADSLDRTKTTPGFAVRVPTRLEMVRPVRKVLEALLASLGWSEDDVADVGLVATEVIQNAVEHGSRNDGSESVDVRCGVEEEAFVVEVVDPGTGKGASSLLDRDVTVPPPVDASRGRGLYLVHRMAKHMHRASLEGGGCLV